MRVKGLLFFRGLTKRWFSKGVVLADVPTERKPGTRVHADVPPERKLERGYIRQNYPFTNPPFCLPMIFTFRIGFNSRAIHFASDLESLAIRELNRDSRHLSF